MREDILKTIGKIKVTSDGADFLNYLKELSKDNYEGFKKASQEMNDVHKGRALALDSLIALFDNCEQLLALENKTQNTDWGF